MTSTNHRDTGPKPWPLGPGGGWPKPNNRRNKRNTVLDGATIALAAVLTAIGVAIAAAPAYVPDPAPAKTTAERSSHYATPDEIRAWERKQLADLLHAQQEAANTEAQQ